MWDEDRCNEFVKENYPHYYEEYITQPHIVRIDIVRFMILYHFGGIYADMDMYCYDNFYDGIQKSLSLAQSNGDDEIVTNCLMITTPKHPFFSKCIDLSFKRIREFVDQPHIVESDYYVKYIGGPFLLSDVYRETRWFYSIDIMPTNLFIGSVDAPENNKNLLTKHLLTGIWGQDVFETLKASKKEKGCDHMTDGEYYLHHYKIFRKADIDQLF